MCPIKSAINHNTLHPFTVEYLAPGLISERSADGLVNIFVLDTTSAKTIEALQLCSEKIFLQSSHDMPLLLLYDLRKTNSLAHLNTILSQLTVLIQHYPDVIQRIALVVSELTEIAPITCCETVSVQHFVSRQQAMLWLLS